MNMSAAQNQTSMICVVEVRPENPPRSRFYATAVPSQDYVDISGVETFLGHLPRGRHLIRLDVAVHLEASHLEPLEEGEMEEEF